MALHMNHATCISIPSQQLYVDASLEGWDAHPNDQVTSGMWSSEGRSSHFNVLELTSVINAVNHWKQILCEVMVAMDNVTVTALVAHTQHLYCN